MLLNQCSSVLQHTAIQSRLQEGRVSSNDLLSAKESCSSMHMRQTARRAGLGNCDGSDRFYRRAERTRWGPFLKGREGVLLTAELLRRAWERLRPTCSPRVEIVNAEQVIEERKLVRGKDGRCGKRSSFVRWGIASINQSSVRGWWGYAEFSACFRAGRSSRRRLQLRASCPGVRG
jgi:hypothetical protein